MTTAGDLRRLLADVDDDVPIIIWDETRDRFVDAAFWRAIVCRSRGFEGGYYRQPQDARRLSPPIDAIEVSPP